MSTKKVEFHYNSETKKITMHFEGNLVVTNDNKAEIVGPTIDVLGYAPNSIPIIAAKECLEEMLALVKTVMDMK